MSGQGKSALGIVRKYHPQVNRIVEAKKPIQIEVTARDCRNGKSGKASSCAMARACEREFDGAIIAMSTAYIIKGDVATRYKVPQSVAREIVSFDRSHKFEPGTYSLVKSGFKLGDKQSTTSKLPKAKQYGKQKRRNHKTAGIRAL
jgi:hypothetical protein